MFLQQAAHAPSCEAGAISVQEEGWFPALLGFAQRKIGFNALHRHVSDRAQSLAPALAANPYQLLLGIKVAKVQADKLTDPQTSSIKRLEHGPVTHSQGRIDGNRIEQSNHVIDLEQSW